MVLMNILLEAVSNPSSLVPEKTSLLESSRCKVKFGHPTGLMFVGGVSSSYDLAIDDSVDVSGVVEQDELTYIIRQFNESLQSYWPCTAVYACGYVMAPFTLGASLFAPNYCISHAEAAGTRCLEQISLKGVYYHKDIKFQLKKTWGCSSYLELSFPADLLLNHDTECGVVEGDSDLKQRKGTTITVAPGSAGLSGSVQKKRD